MKFLFYREFKQVGLYLFLYFLLAIPYNYAKNEFFFKLLFSLLTICTWFILYRDFEVDEKNNFNKFVISAKFTRKSLVYPRYFLLLVINLILLLSAGHKFIQWDIVSISNILVLMFTVTLTGLITIPLMFKYGFKSISTPAINIIFVNLARDINEIHYLWSYIFVFIIIVATIFSMRISLDIMKDRDI